MRYLLRLALAAAVLMPAAPALSQEGPQWGSASYPLFGNLRSLQGTVLIRFVMDEPVNTPPGPWYQPSENYKRFSLAEIAPNEQNRILFYNKSVTRHAGGEEKPSGKMMAGLDLPAEERLQDRLGNPSAGGRSWEAGSAHVIGYSWTSQGVHRFWADQRYHSGQEIPYPSLGVGQVHPEQGKLVLAPNNRDSAVTVLGVHTLNRAITEEEAGRPPEKLFQPMEGTMLLDTFENEQFQPDGETQTEAEVISGYSGEQGGVPSEETRFVDTPYGRGLRLYTPPEKTD